MSRAIVPIIGRARNKDDTRYHACANCKVLLKVLFDGVDPAKPWRLGTWHCRKALLQSRYSRTMPEQPWSYTCPDFGHRVDPKSKIRNKMISKIAERTARGLFRKSTVT